MASNMPKPAPIIPQDLLFGNPAQPGVKRKKTGYNSPAVLLRKKQEKFLSQYNIHDHFTAIIQVNLC